VTIEQTYVTERGRKRRAAVRVDLDEVRRGLGLPGVADRGDWERIRTLLLEAVGESQFEIWLEPLELIAIDRPVRLVVAAPATRARGSGSLRSAADALLAAQSRELAARG
jgi:hypothetical protein